MLELQSTPTTVLWGIAATLTGLLLLVWTRVNRSVLSRLPGPKPESFLLGNQMQYETSPLGECDLAWFKKFGRTFRYKGGWGENVLYTSDPKALQFILQTSAYGFEKPPITILLVRQFLGSGILGTEHDSHKRQRKVMLPAFQMPQTKALFPTFHDAAVSLVSFLTAELSANGEGLGINTHPWMSKATLDAIGEAAFGAKFGALDESDTRLSKVFKDILIRAKGGAPTNLKTIIFNTVFAFPPQAGYLVSLLLQRARTKASTDSKKVSFEVGKELLDQKLGEVSSGGGEKDVMSLLIQANNTENPKTKMTEDEILGGMSAVMVAGHETTATSTTFALWELAKHPEIQNKLRAEIRTFLKAALDRGESCIPVSDYEQMEYTQAITKETLRFHALVPIQTRSPIRDVVIPLAHPVTTIDGEHYDKLPIKKGTRVMVSLTQYNRLEELWGPDAQEFNPERWLRKESKEADIKFGVYANLGTFGAGIHACIGWRFAVYEIQTFLIELINNFRFELTPEAKTAWKGYVGIAVPLVKGKENESTMPLRIYSAA